MTSLFDSLDTISNYPYILSNHINYYKSYNQPQLYNWSKQPFEDEMGFTYMINVPEMTKEDVNICIINNILEIRGTKSIRNIDHTFKTQYNLPHSSIDTNNIKAKLQNYILSIFIPKTNSTNVQTQIINIE